GGYSIGHPRFHSRNPAEVHVTWFSVDDASTPRSFKHYTHHPAGASFGTKFEGLAVSRALPQQIGGLYHAGSVGIIMSGWLGAMNYGVIVANEVDNHLCSNSSLSTDAAERSVVEDVAAG
ncbi:MAG: hypothetical protein AAF589_05620, partial [Planctomycetota bacterium]